MCASTRANYYLRALPPSQSRAFAESHDQAMLNTLFALLDHPDGEREDVHWARMVAQLPLRLGGLGLRSAVRVAPAAYWASWADCLEMIQRRHPVLAAMFTNALSAEAPSPAPCLHELQPGRVTIVLPGRTWRGGSGRDNRRGSPVSGPTVGSFMRPVHAMSLRAPRSCSNGACEESPRRCSGPRVGRVEAECSQFFRLLL